MWQKCDIISLFLIFPNIYIVHHNWCATSLDKTEKEKFYCLWGSIQIGIIYIFLNVDKPKMAFRCLKLKQHKRLKYTKAPFGNFGFQIEAIWNPVNLKPKATRNWSGISFRSLVTSVTYFRTNRNMCHACERAGHCAQMTSTLNSGDDSMYFGLLLDSRTLHNSLLITTLSLVP